MGLKWDTGRLPWQPSSLHSSSCIHFCPLPGQDRYAGILAAMDDLAAAGHSSAVSGWRVLAEAGCLRPFGSRLKSRRVETKSHCAVGLAIVMWGQAALQGGGVFVHVFKYPPAFSACCLPLATCVSSRGCDVTHSCTLATPAPPSTHPSPHPTPHKHTPCTGEGGNEP